MLGFINDGLAALLYKDQQLHPVSLSIGKIIDYWSKEVELYK